MPLSSASQCKENRSLSHNLRQVALVTNSQFSPALNTTRGFDIAMMQTGHRGQLNQHGRRNLLPLAISIRATVKWLLERWIAI